MKYYILSTGQPAPSPWRINSPDGTESLVKTLEAPEPFIRTLTASKARTLAAKWSPSTE